MSTRGHSNLPLTMRAWQYTSTTTGLENNLILNPEAPVPTLSSKYGDSEILIQVLSTSLNPADYKVPELGLIVRAVIRTPATPCMDFCGRVVAATRTVDTFRVGELVFGRLDVTQHGTCGEYIVAPTKVCSSVPAGLDSDTAASIPCAGMTAYQCIAPHVKAGDKVFINGGSGGAGTFGIQIAKALGCFVTVACSSAKVEQCKGLGADEVIDYTAVKSVSQTLKEGGQVYKLCVDNVGLPGDDLYKAADGYLLPEGRYIQVGGPMSFASLKSAANNFLRPSFWGGGSRKIELFMLKGSQTQDLDQLGKWAVEGKVKPVVEEVYAFEDLPEAFRKLKTGKCAGKLVIRIARKEDRANAVSP
ncbi:hypothetical protein B0H66DRAFT_395761 [Apodospora peruviana]|uniref:Enoyl reductase (ER) domain-containing protein n=1 Tax=Apodospora peruviana TaxID=516989 RepID=A0AAE0LYA1_9PEZI|nr:hypothetical protein B0H66DRAFT_395761 [Apodospora peruviana]